MDAALVGESCFLEAHYYSGGLRHHAVGMSGKRPDWAPPADAVGFRDEFTLTTGDVVIEFQRRNFRDQLVTWVGLYSRSVDEKLGERENHAGLGLWLLELSIVDVRTVVDALALMFEKLLGGFDARVFEVNARKFISKHLPDYVQSAKAFLPGFPGAAFTTAELPKTSFYQVTGPAVSPNLHLAADQLSLLMFSPRLSSSMRALIVVSNLEKRSIGGGEFQPITSNMDPMGQLISTIPQVLASPNEQIRKYQSEHDQISRQLAEAREIIRSIQFEKDEIQSNFNAVIVEVDNLKKGRDLRSGHQSNSKEMSLILSRLSDIERKLSRLINEQGALDARGDQQDGGIQFGWELILIVFLGLVGLALLGWGGAAAFSALMANRPG